MALPKYSARVELYRRLIEISRDLVSTLDRNELLLRIVNAAADLCGAEAASILMFDENRQELYFEVASNLEEQILRGMSVPIDSSLAGWIVTNRQAIIIHDALHDSRHFSRIGEQLQMTIYSLIGVPLIAKQKVVGVVEAINKIEGEFNDEDLDLLSALAAQAAIAIENSRLFQQSDFIAELVHELRTPMASLNTAIQMLVRNDIEEEQRQYLVTIIQSEISRLSDLTTSFLDLARIESGRVQFKTEELNLDILIKDCMDLMYPRTVENKIDLDLEIPPDLPPAKADADKLKQVIINLLSNAIKYNYPGGKIEVKAFQEGNKIGFSIANTGPGMSQAEMDHLFEKFYRVPGTEKLAYGTGLGLSICKQIIDAHRGSIQVDSTIGQGTTFRISLPL